MKPYLRHPKLVIKLIVMPCDKRKPGNAKKRVLKARNVSKNGVKIKRCALLHRDIYNVLCTMFFVHWLDPRHLRVLTPPLWIVASPDDLEW